MMFKKLTTRFVQNPRSLFLIDGLGALVTAIMLGLVLPRFEHFFGFPSSMLYVLALFPIVYMCYDFYCYRSKDIDIAKSLSRVAIMNIIYCFISFGFAIYHRGELSIWAWIYILNEIIIIIALSIFELYVARNLQQRVPS